MTHQVPLNKVILEEFIRIGCLSKTEEMIMRTRVHGWTITKQSYELNMSESNIKKIIARLKKKYDNAEKYSAILPPRKQSEKELYMDENWEAEMLLFFFIYVETFIILFRYF